MIKVNKTKKGQGMYFGIGIAIFCIGVLIAFVVFAYVPAGTVGVRDRIGVVNDVALQPGVYYTGFLTGVETFSTRIQLREYEASSASKDLQVVNTKIALNFKINPASAPEIYKTIGSEYQDIIIAPVIQEAVKSSTAKYTAENLVKDRTAVKNDITNYITDKLVNKGLIVTEVAITNFDFSSEFNSAIERKQVAEQDALTAENKLKEMTFTAEAMKLQSQVIEIKKLDIEILKLDIERARIAKWDGKMPTVYMTSQNSESPTMLMDISQIQ